MGQKTNPNLLRLEKTNQHFKSCWYSKHYYSDQLHNNFKIRDYITKIFDSIQKRLPLKFIKNNPKANRIRCLPLIYIKNCYQSNQILCFVLKKGRKRFERFKYKKQITHKTNNMILSKKWSLFYGAVLNKKTKNHVQSIQNGEANSNEILVGHVKRSTRNEPLGGVCPKAATGTSAYKVKTLFYSHKIESPSKEISCYPPREAENKLHGGYSSANTLLVLSLFYKQLSLLLSSKSLVQSRGSQKVKFTKIKHKIRMENVINLNNFRSKLFLETLLPLRSTPREDPQVTRSLATYPEGLPNSFLAHSSYLFAENDGRIKKFDFDGFISTFKRPWPRVANLCGQDDLQTSRKKVHLYPIKVSKVQQNSDFLAQKIIGNLKKRATYHRIRHQILRDVAKSPYIKGIRVTLSGRVNSRSKKAQKARTNTFHWGQTELHVFSSLVQFTSNYCTTPFGKIGIKVWVCYHARAT